MAVDFFQAQNGAVQYVIILDAVANKWWNAVTPGFETFNGANFTSYPIFATEYGTTGLFSYTIPATLPAGIYSIQARTRVGGAAAQSDPNGAAGMVQWDGSIVVPLSAISAKTGQMAFTVANRLDANARLMNSAPIQGTGVPADKWRGV